MQEIKKRKDKYHIPAISAEIIGTNMISGQKGKEIDYQKSYTAMKRYGSFNETLITLKEVKPVISIEENYDKYLIRGNREKKEIALVFIVQTENNFPDIIKVLEQKEVTGTFFIDGTILEQNMNFIKKHLTQEYEILSYQNSYHKAFLKTSQLYLETITKKDTKYCYTEKENQELLEICKNLKKHTIKSSNQIEKNFYQNIKKNLSNGMIISLEPNNYIKKELSMTIDYIEEKGYQVVNLEKLLKE